MADQTRTGDLRQQVVSIYNSLLNAVDALESTSRPSGSGISNVPSCRETSNSGISRLSSVLKPSQTSSSSEIKHLFHYNTSFGKRRNSKGSESLSKKKKLKTWSHAFVCLSCPDQNEPPDSKTRAKLQLAGLGEKRLSLFHDGGPEELHEELMQQYPKLSSGGGYELLRASGNRKLEIIPVPHEGCSVNFLRSVVHSAKVYVRPIQRDLDMTPSPINQWLPISRQEKCLECGNLVPLHMLREHILACKSTLTDEVQLADESDDKEMISDSPEDMSNDDDSMLQYAIQLSRQEASLTEPSYFQSCEISSIDEVITMLRQNLMDKCFTMVISRTNVLEEFFRRTDKKSFDPSKKLRVEFVGEEGIDTGGLTRELFTLLVKAISPKYIQNGYLLHDSIALRDRVYYKLGQLASMCLVQGGAGFNILSLAVFEYVCGKDISNIIIPFEDVMHLEAKELINEIQCVSTLDELKDVYSTHIDKLSDCGITKPTSLLTLEDKWVVAHSIAQYHCLLRHKAELDQFSDGLVTLGTRDAIRKYPVLLSEFFTNCKVITLTADLIKNLFKVMYSEVGSNERAKEECTYIYFIDYLEECEEAESIKEDIHEKKITVTLHSVLNFFFGAEEIPPMGFPCDPVLRFNASDLYPTASTCAIELTLPTQYSGDYESFKNAMDVALTCHDGFGKS